MASPPYLHSNPNSPYGSPSPSQWSGDVYPGQQGGIIGYGPYGSPIPLHGQPLPYGSPPIQNIVRDASTPPTSSHSQDESNTTRRRAPPSKRKNKSSTSSIDGPSLEAPLSELTKHMTDIPLRDMDAWANRSVEERLLEVEKSKEKKVSRPMNSFMMYRSAYADRAKRYCEQSNHQIVSCIAGKSWNKEPPEVRKMYAEFARIERENHQKAHPNYKFSPGKTSKQTARKRKDTSDDEDYVLDPSEDDDDADPNFRPSGGSKRRSRNAATNGHAPVADTSHYQPYPNFGEGDMSYSLHHGPEPVLDNGYGSYYHIHGQPVPAHVADNMQNMQQYVRAQQTTFELAQQQQQQQQRQQQQSVVGLPGTGHFDLMDEQSMGGTPAAFDVSQLDPELMSNGYPHNFDGQMHAFSHANISNQAFRDLDDDLLASMGGGMMQQWEQPQPHRSEVEAEMERLLREDARNE